MPLPRPTRPKKEPQKQQDSEPADLRPSDVFRFDPKSDITAEELGYLVSIFWTLDVNHERFFNLPTNVQRHFRPIENG